MMHLEDNWQSLLHSTFSQPCAARGVKSVHASDITKPSFCQRKVQIARDTNISPGFDYNGASTQMTFALGNAIEDELINKMCSNDKIDVYSNWLWQGFKLGMGTREEIMRTAGSSPLMQKMKKIDIVPSNIRLLHRGISGGVDLLMKLKYDSKYTLFEVKTIKQDDFIKLESPLPEHHQRTSLYLGLTESEHGMPITIDSSMGYVIYVSKGFGVRGYRGRSGFTPFKVFHVPIDRVLNEALFNKAAWDGQGSKYCSSYDKGVNIRCPYVEECFNSKALT